MQKKILFTKTTRSPDNSKFAFGNKTLYGQELCWPISIVFLQKN